MRPLYHVGDSVIIYDIRLDGIVIAYPRGNFLLHDEYDLTHSPFFSNFDYLYDDESYDNKVRTTSDGEIYTQIDSRLHIYTYIIQLSTGEMVSCYENELIVKNRDPLYHVGDLVIINYDDTHLVGNIIAYPPGDFLIHEKHALTREPSVVNYDILYEDDEYRNRIYTTSDGQIYAFNISEINYTYLYIIQLSTGENVFCFEDELIPFKKELLTRTISKYNGKRKEFHRRRKEFNRRIRDDTVAAIALGTKMPLEINRRIASLTLSRNVGGRKRKTRKTRKTRK